MSEKLRIEYVDTDKLIPYINNPKKHPKEQVKQIASSIKEEWRFYSFNSDYIVTKSGDVFSVCHRQTSRKGNSIIKYRLRKLKGSIDRYGYKTVRIRVDGKKKHIKVHRIVAIMFIENPLNKPQVNHKNMNKLDNSVSNLEWVTDIENKAHYNKKMGFKFNKELLDV